MNSLALGSKPRSIEVKIDEKSLREDELALYVRGSAQNVATCVCVTFHADAQDDPGEYYREEGEAIISSVLPTSKRQALLDNIRNDGTITLTVLDVTPNPANEQHPGIKVVEAAPRA